MSSHTNQPFPKLHKHHFHEIFYIQHFSQKAFSTSLTPKSHPIKHPTPHPTPPNPIPPPHKLLRPWAPHCPRAMRVLLYINVYMYMYLYLGCPFSAFSGLNGHYHYTLRGWLGATKREREREPPPGRAGVISILRGLCSDGGEEQGGGARRFGGRWTTGLRGRLQHIP